MDSLQYTNKKGNIRFRPVLTVEEVESLLFNDNLNGFCCACGECELYGVEPDAELVTCESCGEPAAFGVEQLVLRGIARVIDNETREPIAYV